MSPESTVLSPESVEYTLILLEFKLTNARSIKVYSTDSGLSTQDFPKKLQPVSMHNILHVLF